MSTSYSMMTGVVAFRGEPKVTPLVSMLFAPFNLTRAGLEPSEACLRRIYVTETCGQVWWHTLAQNLAGYARALGIALPQEACAGDVLKALGGHYGGGDVPSIVSGIDFDEPVQAADLAKLCRAIPDGNNVESLRWMGGYRNTKPWLWETGGWSGLESPRLAIELGTFSLLNYLDAIDRALSMQDAQGAASVVCELVEGLLDGVADPVHAQQIRQAVLGGLAPQHLKGLLRNQAADEVPAKRDAAIA